MEIFDNMFCFRWTGRMDEVFQMIFAGDKLGAWYMHLLSRSRVLR